MCSAPKLRALAALCSLPGHSTPGLRGSLPCPSALCPPGHRLDQAFPEPPWRKETPPLSPRRAPPNPKPFGDRSPQVSQTRTPGSAGPSVRCGCPHEETETYSLSTDGTLREGRGGMAVHMPSPCLVSAGSSQIGRAARRRLHPRSRPRLFPHVPGLRAGRRSVLALGSERQGPARVAAARPWALSPPPPPREPWRGHRCPIAGLCRARGCRLP